MTDALTPEAEVVRICRDLIRIDSSNYGDGSGPGERACAEYVMGELTEVGLDPLYVESAPGRANILVRIEGRIEVARGWPFMDTSTSCRPTPLTGGWIPLRPRSGTAASGGEVRST